MFENLAGQTVSFYVCFATISILASEALARRHLDWAVPSLVAYATVAAWYLVEPIYLASGLTRFSEGIIDDAFLEVTGFLLSFRIAVPVFTKLAMPNQSLSVGTTSKIPAETYLVWLAVFWVCLLAVGVYRMEGDILGALFPLGRRFDANMWARAAAGDAGATGFLVSLGGYLYTLVCASFGILLPFLQRRPARIAASLLIGLSWPFFLLEGSRNIFLAVLVPSAFSYLLFARRSFIFKGVTCGLLFLGIDIWFRIILGYRNIGLMSIFDEGNTLSQMKAKHDGLNMLSELCFINSFYEVGMLKLSLGLGYLENLMNIIPRAIWPDKPFIGIDYAILRGYSALGSDIGVFATISTGLIGQGVVNFGPLLGPIIAGLLFAIWIAILARFRRQGHSVLRLTLFLLGLGLTFNLGRDLTLLVIWPFLLGYLLVQGVEWYFGARSPSPKGIIVKGA
jgi:hypothetical protein